MKAIAEILIEQGAFFDTEDRGNGEIVYKIKQHFTEYCNGTPIRSYWKYTTPAIIADISGKILRFEEIPENEFPDKKG